MIIVVTPSNTVFATALPRLRVYDMPQKQKVKRRTMNVTAPLLKGSPRILTKKRSEYAAAFGMRAVSDRKGWLPG